MGCQVQCELGYGARVGNRGKSTLNKGYLKTVTIFNPWTELSSNTKQVKNKLLFRTKIL